MPKVSVIIPTYNHAHYLPYTIQSVLAQTFTQWEAIIVDDGSTDNPAAVVTRFADPRIRYIHQENQGLSAARNTGIRAAQGEYLAFLDADDEWAPEFLRRCVDVLAADDTLAGVYTRNRFIDQSGHILPQLSGQVVPRATFRSRLLEGGFSPPHAALVRTAIVRQVGLFDTRLTSTEDWDLWLRISEHYQMQAIPEPLARYRVYPGSMSTNAPRMHSSRIAVLTKYFGPPDGDPVTWSEEKRRTYGFAYRCSCIGYIQQGQPDQGWSFLAQAVSLWPDLLRRLDTFYELACGDKPGGYRGQAGLLDIEATGADVLRRLNDLLAQAGPALRSMRGVAFGNACLALGILSDQAGRWATARRYLLQAIRANPRLLASYSVVRRLLKLCAGQKLAGVGRRVFPSGQRTAHHTQ